jgi:hypothetical protein
VNGVPTWLCRRAEPLPTGRVEGIVRGFRVIAIVSVATLGAAWVSLLLAIIAVTTFGVAAVAINVRPRLAARS